LKLGSGNYNEANHILINAKYFSGNEIF